MLCMGSHRKPSSFRSELDLILLPVCTPSDAAEGRDLRIRLMAEIFNATAQGLSAKCVPNSGIEQVYTVVQDSLEELDCLLRAILPLSGKLWLVTSSFVYSTVYSD